MRRAISLALRLGRQAPAGLVAEHVARRTRAEVVVEDLEAVERDERRVRVAARVREVQELLAQRREVVREARALERRIEAAHQPRFWVATPVGQWPVWQRCAWMQPIDSIASRATLIMSQPSASASSAGLGEAELARADEHDLVLARRPRRTSCRPR